MKMCEDKAFMSSRISLRSAQTLKDCWRRWLRRVPPLYATGMKTFGDFSRGLECAEERQRCRQVVDRHLEVIINIFVARGLTSRSEKAPELRFAWAQG